MLTHLHVRNFKSWERAELELTPITGLFGANSSGKSAILQFLLLLKQTKDATDRGLSLDFGNERTPANLGSFHDAIFKHDDKRKLEWQLAWRPSRPLTIRPAGHSALRTEELSVKSAVESKAGRAVCTGVEYQFGPAKFALHQQNDGTFGLEADAAGFQFVRVRGRPPKLPGPMKSYAFPDLAKTNFQNADFLAEFEATYEAQMDALFHLGPLREYPRRQYGWAGAKPTDVGRRGEYVVEALLAARKGEKLAPPGKTRRTRPFEAVIAQWLEKIELVEGFRVEEIGKDSNLYRVWVRRNRSAPEVLITDVGFGVSQVLPVIVLLHYVPEGSTVILEQPEIHLHPSVQADLADVIIHAARNRSLQVIIESHSEHLLRRLQLRIADETISAREAKLYFCRMAGGASLLEPLELDIFGHILNWPKHFFGDEFGEISAIEEATLRRQAAAE